MTESTAQRILQSLREIQKTAPVTGGATEAKQNDIITALSGLVLEVTAEQINLNTDTLEASNDAIQVAVESIDTKTLAKSNLYKLENQANDLVTTISYLDAGLADERENTIVYSSVALGLTVTKTLGYNGASPYRVLTITLS